MPASCWVQCPWSCLWERGTFFRGVRRLLAGTLNVCQVKKVTQFPWTCKLAVHSFGITTLKAIWAISGCGYCSHHRVTSEMWVRSWHWLPACWVISLTFGMCCFASTPSPFLLCHVFNLGFFISFLSWVYLWVDLLSSWLEPSTPKHLAFQSVFY